MSIPLTLCRRCNNCGLIIESNAKDSEYYSQYYGAKFLAFTRRVTTCACGHGQFVKSYYNFPTTNITNMYHNEQDILVVDINEILVNFHDLLYNWIKYKSLTPP
jgi:hypothetical protein